jgi:4'-phosphopantetheinyl transferase
MSGPLWHSCGMAGVAAGAEWLAAAEANRFSGIRYTKRRTEALLGRWTAKQTIAAAMGMGDDPADLASVVVRNAADGAPEVFVDDSPVDVAIAMTDRADWAVTAVRHGLDRIGCDLELVEPRSDRFIADYFTPAEQALIDAGDRDLLANLMWSAKESSLKVLRTGLRRDTRSAEVSLTPGSGDRWTGLSVTVDGSKQNGWWIRYGDFVLTVTAAVPIEPPHAIVEPPPLASAVPSHSWMTDTLAGCPNGDLVRPGPKTAHIQRSLPRP